MSHTICSFTTQEVGAACVGTQFQGGTHHTAGTQTAATRLAGYCGCGCDGGAVGQCVLGAKQKNEGVQDMI